MAERLEIDALRTLKAVQDYGGVTRAANFLSLTQSAVSHKIRRLERNIGCQLLRRKPGQELFTEDGKHLVSYAEKIISIHDEAVLGINRPTLKGRIRLGITEELVTSGLSDILGRFSRLYPGVNVKTRVEQSLVLDEMLKKSSLDMAVMQVFKHDVKDDDLVIDEDRLVWVKSSSYEMPDEKHFPFIAFDLNCFYRQWAIREFAGTDKQLNVVLECASNEGVCSAVTAGMGVALIARRHLRPNMEEIDLVTPPDITFVIRNSDHQPGRNMMVLRDDILSTMAR